MVRLTEPMDQVGAMVLASILTVGVLAGVGLSATRIGAAVVLAGSIATVIFCTRVFRGGSEEVEPPRAWGRMTEKPATGYILAGLFALQSVGLLLTGHPTSPLLRAIAVVAYVLLAAAFAFSSWRLSTRRLTA